jgi:hypothetical protein
VPVPDGQRAEIRIAQKGQLVRSDSEDFGGGHSLAVSHLAHLPNGSGHEHESLAIQHERPLVVVAIGEPDDAHRQFHGHRLLDDAGTTKGLVIRMRREHEDPVIRIERGFGYQRRLYDWLTFGHDEDATHHTAKPDECGGYCHRREQPSAMHQLS